MPRHDRTEHAQVDPLPGREPAQARALRVLRDWILNGHYAANQTLPSEEEMADQIKVSRGTLRLAIQRLKNEGVLQTQQGRRHVVASSPGDSLMSSTIILLCGKDEATSGLHGSAFEAVDSGCFDTARDLHRNLLTLHVAWLKGTTRKLLSDPPYGVIFSEFAADYGPEPPW